MTSWPTRSVHLSAVNPSGSVAASYAAARGRISSSELASLVKAQSSNVGSVLRALEDEGVLEPSQPNRRGQGFFYRFTGAARS